MIAMTTSSSISVNPMWERRIERYVVDMAYASEEMNSTDTKYTRCAGGTDWDMSKFWAQGRL